MATKALNINQHIPLHNLYPDNCCLCKAEEKIKELECVLSLEKSYISREFHTQHFKENKEYYEKKIKKLKEQLFLSKQTCDVCWTSSFVPVPKNYQNSLQVKGKKYNVMCQMCEANETIHKLIKAISPDGRVTKTSELIELCQELWKAI